MIEPTPTPEQAFRDYLEAMNMSHESADVLAKLRLTFEYFYQPETPAKSWLKSRTIIFNAALALIASIVSIPAINAVIPVDAMPWITAVLLLGNVILRFVTVEPITSVVPLPADPPNIQIQ